MGGIQCIVPHNALKNEEISKLNKLPKVKDIIKKGIVHVEVFERNSEKNWVIQFLKI